MDSSPSAKRDGPSGEKTGVSSRSPSGHSAAAQRELSRAASRAMTSQMESSAAEEVTGRLPGRLDLGLAVRGRDEQRLELGGRDVDAAGEQVAEPGGVALGIARARVLEAPHRARVEEEGRERTHPLHADRVLARRLQQTGLQLRARLFEPLVDGRVAQ